MSTPIKAIQRDKALGNISTINSLSLEDMESGQASCGSFFNLNKDPDWNLTVEENQDKIFNYIQEFNFSISNQSDVPQIPKDIKVYEQEFPCVAFGMKADIRRPLIFK